MTTDGGWEEHSADVIWKLDVARKTITERYATAKAKPKAKPSVVHKVRDLLTSPRPSPQASPKASPNASPQSSPLPSPRNSRGEACGQDWCFTPRAQEDAYAGGGAI